MMSNIDFYDDNITVEWIDGIKYMIPSPHPNHGVVYKKIFIKIANYLEGKESANFFLTKLTYTCLILKSQ
jgi:hypothetical protein